MAHWASLPNQFGPVGRHPRRCSTRYLSSLPILKSYMYQTPAFLIGSIRTIQRDFLWICRFLSRLVVFLGNHLHRLFIIRLHPLGHDLGRIECRCGEYDDDFRALLWERSAFGFWGTCCCTFHYPPAYDGRSRSMSPFDRSTGC